MVCSTTTKDIRETGASGDNVGGLPDCIGGVRSPDHGHAQAYATP